MSAPLADDLERLVPDRLSDDPIERAMLAIHRSRYEFAARYVKGKSVLDLACGVGYGSAILKEAGASTVLGVDLSEEAIAYARDRYGASGLDFQTGDAMHFKPAIPIDVAVSLETIEHLPDPHTFLRRLVGIVAPGGLVIGSVPTTLSTDVNPYHLHDFSDRQFREMFAACGLVVVDELTQAQRFSPLGFKRLSKTSQRNYSLRKGLPGYYLRHPGMLARRLWASVVDGFVNRYLLLVGRKS